MFINKEGNVRSGWLIAGVTAAALAIIIVLSIVLNFGALILSAIFSGSGNPAIISRIFSILDYCALVIQEGVMILVPVIVWRYILKRPLTSMGLGGIKNHSRDFFIGLLFGIVSISAVFAALVITGNAVVVSWAPNFSWGTVTQLLVYISVGFAEEIYGRGFIMSALRQTKNIYVTVLVSAGIFALLHSFNSGLGWLPYLNLFLVGILFAYMYLRSGNIWLGIGYHITWNYFQGSVFGFLVSGAGNTGIIQTFIPKANIFNGGSFGPEGGLIVTFMILLGFIFVRYYYRDKEFNFFKQVNTY